MTDAASLLLPPAFRDWFDARGWRPRPHQLALIAKAQAGASVLLIAPTGAGKTLSGFLPSLIELAGRRPHAPGGGLHTLYVSPLKALAVDVARNLFKPVEDMGLPVRIETRTGDTPEHKRRRQKIDPPDILLTTPEQLALLTASAEAERLFSGLRAVILDELHALVTSKRGDQLALGLARLRALSPRLRATGLSATVADPDDLRGWLMPQTDGQPRALADLVTVAGGAPPEVAILEAQEGVPWAGHSAAYAHREMLAAIKAHRTTLVFVNTRAQAERLFQELWRLNDETLPIALHHGSLDVAQRRRVEAAMAENRLKAVVATSTLDLGIDWGEVDLVIHVGAPKGASRLAQRIGRANHRMDEPSRALLVPANRFEVLECRAALEATRRGDQDTPPIRPGALDVLAQHVLGRAVAGPFEMGDFFDEVRSAYPYRHLPRATFDRVVDFVATGGYALKAYERFARIRRRKDGLWRVSNPQVAQTWRLNVGTIVEMPMLKVRLVSAKTGMRARFGGKVLGEIEDYFLESLVSGDTFRFAGETLAFLGIRENEALVTRAHDRDAKVPAYSGGRFPLSTFLAEGVRAMLADRNRWRDLPDPVREWLELQALKSRLPDRDGLLVETFPHERRHFMVAYPFEGRLAHQTLGMLLTRRLERAGLDPLGFVASDYAIAVWGLGDLSVAFASRQPSLGALFDEDMLGDDLDAWLAESALMKRSFRNCAVIAGMIERRHPGAEKTGRQVTISTDLIYDVLRTHEPDHILIEAARADAAAGLIDAERLGKMLARIRGRITHQPLEHVSPLAVPVLLDIGVVPVSGAAEDRLLAESAEDLIRLATEA